MYLKSIELQGFKSFAQKTILDFSGPKVGKNQITAIVGPNGSGKSNVSDAIRWVMGEQSMKNLRGKKSEDIIFNGSDSKGQMSVASVSLTLDNSDGRVPIDYDELVITRKLYRSGESDYLINGKTVRLLDLQILLAKAQFGQGSYSVIGQGTIDRLLLQTSQERKKFFDEACGIKEFQIKRHQAGLKLHRTKENIEQADMLLNEVSPRLKTLSRQVKKLEQRQEVEISLRELQEKYYTTLYNYNKSKLDNISSELEKVEIEYKKNNGELNLIQGELAELASEQSRQGVFENLQNQYQEVIREKNGLEKSRAVLQGKLQAEYSKAGKQNVGWLENKISETKEQQEKLSNELSQADTETESINKKINQQKQRMEELSVRKAELRGEISSLEQRLTQIKSDQSYLQFTGLKAVQAILEERHRFGAVYGAVAQLGEVNPKYQLAMDIAAASQVSSVVVDSDETAQHCIQYLREHQLGFATFLPLSKIKPRFVSQDIHELVHEKGVLGRAVDLVKFDKKFENIFSYVFANTLVIENIEVARRIGIGRVRMVTLDGDVLETSGSMKGGFRQRRRTGLSFSQGASPYLIQGELIDGEEKVEQLQTELEKAEILQEAEQAKIIDLQSQVQSAKNKSEMTRLQKQNLDRELASLEQELSLYTMSPEEYGVAMEDLSVQKNKIDKEIEKVERKLKTIAKKIEDFNKEEEEKKQRVFALQDAMQEKQKNLNKVVEDRNQKRISVAKLETKQEDLANEVYQEMHTSLESILKREASVFDIETLDEISAKIQKLKYKLTLIGGIDEEVVEEYTETKERHEFLVSQLNDLNKAIGDLEKLIKELDEIMKKKRSKAFKEIKKEFSRYFGLLFEGGKADLVELYGEPSFTPEEVMEDEVEDSLDGEINKEKVKKKKEKVLMGIDISACPPGKRIKNIHSLSGGERTLTSIALVCAILHTNPSPFVVLDEVEAALDEANTLRFTKILHELALQSQFIIITHNRATMHAADALYGVTMGNEGVSKLLSVKLEEGKEMVQE